MRRRAAAEEDSVKPPDRINRRAFLLPKPRVRVLELSCERLYMQYADARSGGRLPEFLKGVERELEAADSVRLTAREWLARDDFREQVEPLLHARPAAPEL